MSQESASSHIWSQSVEPRKEELEALLALLERRRRNKPNAVSQVPVITLDEAFQNQDLQSFQAAIDVLAKQFANRKVSALVIKYLYPTFDHVKSFTAGISSATQYESIASLTWGILLVVIQCACIFAESMEEIMSQLGILQSLLPYLEKDLSLYSNKKSLEISLKSIFETYIDFCLVIIRHLAKNPFWALLRNLISSSLRRTLKKTKEKLKSDIEDFDRAVHSAERARAIQVDDVMMQSQAQLLLLAKNSNGTPKSSPTIEYPFQHIMIDRNKSFTGRKKELKTLSAWLSEHKEARPLSISIHGIGGVGKTETAIELAYRCDSLSKYDIILWIPADPEKETETFKTFGHIGRRLGLFDNAEIGEPQVEIVLDWLQAQDRPWLIVFDNVENWENFKRYKLIKSRKPSSVIVTSQTSAPWVDRELDLEPFGRVAGAKFLLQQMAMPQLIKDNTALTIAGEISDELGGSPLYLTHAQGFMKLSKSTLKDYLDIIRTTSTALDMKSDGTWRYGRAASTTHDKILEKLSSGATSLLFMLAFMNPDDISEGLFVDVKFQDLEFLRNKSRYVSFIAELGEGRLIQRTSSGTHYRLRIHRATQAAMLQKLSHNPEQRDVHFRRVIHLLRENFSETSVMMKLQIAEAHVWPRITRVLPHLMTAFSFFERSWPDIEGDIFFAQLLSDVAGMDLYDRGRIEEAYRINKMVEKILDRLGYPRVSRLMADSLAIVGMCSDFMALTKRNEGLEIRKECVKIREQCFAQIKYQDVTLEDRIWLHNSYTDLVCSQQQINDFEGARKNLELCYRQYQEWGTEDEIPYEYSKYFNQMAYVLLYENDSATAVEYSKRGYELVEQATPGAQIATLYKFDYANVLFQHGDMPQALAMLRDLLKFCELDCGKDNVRTLEVRLNIGIVCFFLGKYVDAKKHIEKVLNSTEGGLWPVENVIRGKYYLSQTLKKTDPNDPSAVNLEKEAKDGLDQLLKMDVSGKVLEYQDNLPLLYDYLVHWECRLITPRKVRTTQ